MSAGEEPRSPANGSESSRSTLLKKPLPALPNTHQRARSVGGVEVAGQDPLQADADAYRNKILAELLNTERSYIVSLEQLTGVIKLLRGAPADAVTAKQVARMASNTDMLLNFHRSGLLPQLESLIGRHAPDVNVGSVIISFMPFLKATYAQFVNNYSFAITTLKELAASPKFMTFIAANWKPDGPGSSFETYVDLRLITPVQRIPRYELLLKDLLHHTPKTHQEFATLSEAYNKVKEVAEFVNEKKAEAERMQQLLSLQSSLREDQHRQSIVLAQPGRFLISETKVLVHRSSQKATPEAALAHATSALTLGALSGSQASQGKIIMFNDCLLIARQKSLAAGSAPERLTFSALLYIKPLVVSDLGGLDFSLHADKDALRSSIVKEGKTYKFSALAEASKSQLLSAITDAKILLSSKETSAKKFTRPKLHLAIKQGDMAVVQEVVKSDPSSISAQDRKGQTSLHIAVKKKDQELAKFLLQAGTWIDSVYQRVFDLMIHNDESCANTKTISHDGLTPIDLATKLGDEAMLGILQPKMRAQRQDNEGLLSGVAGMGTAVGSVVGKGLMAPLRMFKREDSNNSLPKKDPSTTLADSGSSPTAGDDKEILPEKVDGSSTTAAPPQGETPSAIKREDRSSRKLIPFLSRDKDRGSGSGSTLSPSQIAVPMPMPTSTSGGGVHPPHSPNTSSEQQQKLISPRVGTEEERKIQERIADIDLHMAALAHERAALLAELQRQQSLSPKKAT